MPANPLQRAEIHVIVSRRLSSSVHVTGLPDEETVELTPGETMILPAAGEPAAAAEPKTIFIPPTIPPPVKALRESQATMRLTASELSGIAPGQPLVVGTASREVRMPAFENVAEQAADTGRALIIVALAGDDE